MATMKKGNDHNKLKDSYLDLKLSFNLIYPRLNLHPYRSHSNLIFGADLKSNMAARVHNVFSLAEILKIFLSETTMSIEL
jgi:hypothetical protein